jgi:hypothetical protein
VVAGVVVLKRKLAIAFGSGVDSEPKLSLWVPTEAGGWEPEVADLFARDPRAYKYTPKNVNISKLVAGPTLDEVSMPRTLPLPLSLAALASLSVCRVEGMQVVTVDCLGQCLVWDLSKLAVVLHVGQPLRCCNPDGKPLETLEVCCARNWRNQDIIAAVCDSKVCPNVSDPDVAPL